MMLKSLRVVLVVVALVVGVQSSWALRCSTIGGYDSTLACVPAGVAASTGSHGLFLLSQCQCLWEATINANTLATETTFNTINDNINALKIHNGITSAAPNVEKSFRTSSQTINTVVNQDLDTITLSGATTGVIIETTITGAVKADGAETAALKLKNNTDCTTGNVDFPANGYYDFVVTFRLIYTGAATAQCTTWGTWQNESGVAGFSTVNVQPASGGQGASPVIVPRVTFSNALLANEIIHHTTVVKVGG